MPTRNDYLNELAVLENLKMIFMSNINTAKNLKIVKELEDDIQHVIDSIHNIDNG